MNNTRDRVAYPERFNENVVDLCSILVHLSKITSPRFLPLLIRENDAEFGGIADKE